MLGNLGSRRLRSVPPRKESFPLRQRLQATRCTARLTSLIRLIVAPPRDLDRCPLHAEQHDDTRDGNASAESRRKHKVVLGPESQVPLSHVDPAEPGDGHGGPSVREGVRREVDTTVEHSHGVQLPHEAGDATVAHILDHEPDTYGGDDADGEAEKGSCVLAIYAEDLQGTDGSPQDGGCEESVWAWTEEAHGWVCWRTDVGDVYLAGFGLVTNDTGLLDQDLPGNS